MTRRTRGRPIAVVGPLSAALATACLLVLTAACGVPTDDTARAIAPERVPFGLAEATTSTSTTVAAPEIDPEAGLNGQLVRLYFAADNQFVAVERLLPASATLEQVLSELAEGPGPEDGWLRARSVVGTDHVASVVLKAGVATVSLTSRFPELPPSEQRLAVAQLVLTLTSRPGVGQVAFSLEEQSVDVPRADGSITRGYVSRDDYRALLRN